jgi:hypothetical protein
MDLIHPFFSHRFPTLATIGANSQRARPSERAATTQYDAVLAGESQRILQVTTQQTLGKRGAKADMLINPSEKPFRHLVETKQDPGQPVAFSKILNFLWSSH